MILRCIYVDYTLTFSKSQGTIQVTRQ